MKDGNIICTMKHNPLIAYLSQFVTPNKWEKMQNVVQHRTRYVTIVLEDVYQAHNVSAAIRSAECFGVQDIHVIEDRNRYAVNVGVTKGASDWVTIYRYRSTESCYQRLRELGYTIVATSPRTHAKAQRHYPLFQLPLASKIALVFGTELTGLTDYALEHADVCTSIPMLGFTESFNISVTVSLCLYDITNRAVLDDKWFISHVEQQNLLLEWLRRSIRGVAELERRFLQM